MGQSTVHSTFMTRTISIHLKEICNRLLLKQHEYNNYKHILLGLDSTLSQIDLLNTRQSPEDFMTTNRMLKYKFYDTIYVK